MESSPEIFLLPQELLQDIMGYITEISDLLTLRLVCRPFLTLTREYKTVSLPHPMNVAIVNLFPLLTEAQGFLVRPRPSRFLDGIRNLLHPSEDFLQSPEIQALCQRVSGDVFLILRQKVSDRNPLESILSFIQTRYEKFPDACTMVSVELADKWVISPEFYVGWFPRYSGKAKILGPGIMGTSKDLRNFLLLRPLFVSNKPLTRKQGKSYDKKLSQLLQVLPFESFCLDFKRLVVESGRYTSRSMIFWDVFHRSDEVLDGLGRDLEYRCRERIESLNAFKMGLVRRIVLIPQTEIQTIIFNWKKLVSVFKYEEFRYEGKSFPEVRGLQVPIRKIEKLKHFPNTTEISLVFLLNPKHTGSTTSIQYLPVSHDELNDTELEELDKVTLPPHVRCISYYVYREPPINH